MEYVINRCFHKPFPMQRTKHSHQTQVLIHLFTFMLIM